MNLHRILGWQLPLLFVLWITALASAPAQETAVPQAQAVIRQAELPDVPALLKAVEEHARETEKIRKDYIFRRTNETQQFDNDGRVKSTEIEEYEVHFVAGQEINRLVAKDGKPLKESEQKKEDEKVAKAEKRARDIAANPAKQEEDEDALTPSKFLAAERFYNLRREMLGGKEVLAFDFEPRPDFKGKGLLGKILRVMIGTMWVDEGAREMVKIHAELRDGMKIGGGFVASVKTGAYMTFENARINDEIWLPSAGEANFGVRVFFVRKNVKVKFRYSDYRKFRTDTKFTVVEGEVPPAPNP